MPGPRRTVPAFIQSLATSPAFASRFLRTLAGGFSRAALLFLAGALFRGFFLGTRFPGGSLLRCGFLWRGLLWCGWGRRGLARSGRSAAACTAAAAPDRGAFLDDFRVQR